MTRAGCVIMRKEPVNPIGSCFDSAAAQLFAGGEPPPGLRLCHGIGIANTPGQEGRRIGHAWIEFDHPQERAAFDTTWDVITGAAHYRAQLHLEYVIEYTREEALALWIKHNYPGPWDERIKAVTDGAEP